MRVCTVDIEGPLSFLDFGGEGPPLVMVHGLGGSALNWMACAAGLTRHARVVALDLPGFGRSPRAGRSTGVEGARRTLDAFLEKVVGAPALLCGNSMGGLISLAEAAQAPRKVAGLLLVNPAQPMLVPGVRLDPAVVRRFALHAVPWVGELTARAAFQRLGARGLVDDMLGLCCVDVGKVPPEVLAAHVAQAEERMGDVPGGVAAYLEAARSLLRFLALPQRFFQLAEQVQCPTLLMHGVHDRLVPFAAARALARRRPGWQFEVFDTVGHVPMLEDAERFVARTVAWMQASARRPAAAPTAVAV